MIRASGGGAEGRDFSVPPPRALEAVPVLGVGLSHLADLPDGFYADGVADFVEITPETLAEASWREGRLVLLPDAERVKRTREACADLPMVAHGVELSIGSVCGMNLACLSLVEALEPLWPCRWYSEHLGFQTVAGPDGRPADIGAPLPLPNTREAARLVAARVREIVGRLKKPFLLENPAHFLASLPSDEGLADEVALMNQVVDLAGCGQLLDLNNLYCNAVNFGFDAAAALGRVRLDRVIEVHLAGASWQDGFLMDAHDGAPAEPVWDLLDQVIERAPNLAGVVFELLDDHYEALGPRGIERELTRVHDAWGRRRRAAA